jgi:hypothetical protein
MKISKNVFKVLKILIFIPIVILIGMLCYDSYYDSKFIDIEIPKSMRFEKTHKEIDYSIIKSLTEDRIEVSGNGYFGYDFYMWHKPTQKGKIYIRAIELTQNIKLSETELENKTTNKIYELSNEYELYKGQSVIYEGTFDKFYPVKFEMWFKSNETGKEKKLAERKYLIDGWDR